MPSWRCAKDLPLFPISVAYKYGGTTLLPGTVPIIFRTHDMMHAAVRVVFVEHGALGIRWSSVLTYCIHHYSSEASF